LGWVCFSGVPGAGTTPAPRNDDSLRGVALGFEIFVVPNRL
jgi:hypothetical protein